MDDSGNSGALFIAYEKGAQHDHVPVSPPVSDICPRSSTQVAADLTS